MKKVLLTAAASVAALLSLSAAASAQTFDQPTFNGSIGYTQAQVDQVVDEDFEEADVDFGAITGRLGARFHPNLGAEAELNIGVNDEEYDFGGGNRAQLGLNYTASVFGMAIAPLSPNFEVFGRLGVGYGELEAETSGPAFGNFSETSDGGFVAFGAGAQYYFDGQNGLRVDYTRYDGEDDGVELDTVSASYTRRF